VSGAGGERGARRVKRTAQQKSQKPKKDFCYSNQINQFATRSNQMTRTKKIERDEVQSELARSGVKRTLE
jgi:hypothetical protein